MGLNNAPDNQWTGNLRVEGDLAITKEYGESKSLQPVASDLTLDAGAGTSDTGDSSFLAAIMGNVLGDLLTKTKNYIAGVIGHFSVTGARATTYPAGAVLAGIGDGVTEADGAVVAYVDGDSALTKANAAFKAMSNNSTPGSGFNFGVDLHGPAHDGYSDLAILKADVRMSHEVCVLTGAGAPVDGTTGATFAGTGSIYVDRTAGKAYINGGTKAAPAWKLITSA